MRNLREFIEALRRDGQLVEVESQVDPCLELAEIHRRVVRAKGPALLFKRVKGSSFPVVTNLFGTDRRINIAFGGRPETFVERAVALLTKDFPPKLSTLWKKRSLLAQMARLGTRAVSRAPVLDVVKDPDLEALPFITSWAEDGGPFLTLPLVYTEGPPNLGMYRIQRFDRKTTGLHFQIAKGGGFHYHKAEQEGRKLPVHIFLGGPPALILSAITPLPENLSEIIVASLLQGSKVGTCSLRETPYPLFSECEFALIGYANPHERRPEGPFGDHYGYYSLQHDFPVFHCTKMTHRSDAIFPATVVGKPMQEDFYIGNYLQKLLSPLFPVVMPGVKALWSYGETGFHSLGAAVISERYEREAMAHAFRILGEGQLALTKTLLLTDASVDLTDFKRTLIAILERCQMETDLYIFSELSMDTLDYTGPKLNKGSRAVLLGMGEKKRDLPEHFTGGLPQPLTAAHPFCAGCLVVEAPPFTALEDLSPLLQQRCFSYWPLIVAVDDLKKALRSTTSFLWTTFTRFEPARDIHASSQNIVRHRLSYKPPILIDARIKPSYPKELIVDDATERLVTQRWADYFPQGMEMGDSKAADAC